jgi:hypothetical protein
VSAEFRCPCDEKFKGITAAPRAPQARRQRHPNTPMRGHSSDTRIPAIRGKTAYRVRMTVFRYFGLTGQIVCSVNWDLHLRTGNALRTKGHASRRSGVLVGRSLYNANPFIANQFGSVGDARARQIPGVRRGTFELRQKHVTGGCASAASVIPTGRRESTRKSSRGNSG